MKTFHGISCLLFIDLLSEVTWIKMSQSGVRLQNNHFVEMVVIEQKINFFHSLLCSQTEASPMSKSLAIKLAPLRSALSLVWICTKTF